MELRTVKISEIKPYPNNPRINDDAVDAVCESIRQCGYINPIVVDENMVVLAGHTRLKALKKLGYKECSVLDEPDLSEEQKQKYRLLHNKTNEFAVWDLELLAVELEGLDFDGFDFGFDMDVVSDADLDEFFEDAEQKEKKLKTVTCPHCGEVFEV